MVRGLDYYTKTVFEAVSTELDITVIAGGRYDYLVEEYKGDERVVINPFPEELYRVYVFDNPLETITISNS